MSEDTTRNAELLELTTQIVTAHVANNNVPVAELPDLIQRIYATLSQVGAVEVHTPRPEPAVAVKKSVGTDFIICLEDGSKHKMMKRYLMTRYNMTPEQYRKRWNLPADYPMVAPSYARTRSALAKKSGLGTRPRRGRGRSAG